MDVKHAVPTTKMSPQPFKCIQSLIPNYNHSSFVFRKTVKSLNTQECHIFEDHARTKWKTTQ